MSDYQEKVAEKANAYALAVALNTPFFRLSPVDVLDRFKAELSAAFVAGVAYGTDKEFLDTKRM